MVTGNTSGEQLKQTLVENVGGNVQLSGSNNEQFDQLVTRNDEDTVPSSSSVVSRSSVKEGVRTQAKRKMKSEGKKVKKNLKLVWKQKDCAKPIGEPIRFTSERGQQQKRHYQAFEFHKEKYALEDSVILVPEEANKELYVAIIKDIYIREKEEYVMLEVQWLYRPEDVEKKSVRNWNSKDAGDLGLFYSFHRDEVYSESVKRNCVVHFVPTNKEIPDHAVYPGYIVQYVYDVVKKTLRPLDYKGFKEIEKADVDLFVEKTILKVGGLPDVATS